MAKHLESQWLLDIEMLGVVLTVQLVMLGSNSGLIPNWTPGSCHSSFLFLLKPLKEACLCSLLLISRQQKEKHYGYL